VLLGDFTLGPDRSPLPQFSLIDFALQIADELSNAGWGFCAGVELPGVAPLPEPVLTFARTAVVPRKGR
jgi:hypothetical protein